MSDVGGKSRLARQSLKTILVCAAITHFVRLPIQVEAIVFRRGEKGIEYLLLKRLPQRNGFWQPVTGGVEEGETREEALRREVTEETGIRKLVAVIPELYRFEFSDPITNQEFVYGVEVLSSEDVVLDRHEHSEYRWCSFQEALRLLHWKENKHALRKLDTILTRHSE